MLWDWLWSLHPRSAHSTDPDKQEGACATGLAEFLHAWVLMIPVTPGFGDRCCVLLTSDPMILGVLEHLGFELTLGIVGLGQHPRSTHDMDSCKYF